MSDILTTKLYIPRARPNLVRRPRLTEQLQAGMDRKLTLITAPVGFGKTTLLSEWIPQSERSVTWVSLDDGDNNFVRFWGSVIAALQMLDSELGGNSLALLQSLRPLPADTILTALLNEIAAFQGSFVHVLDDFQVIRAQPVLAGFQYFLEHIPPNIHLIISSRADPPIPISRLRARDQLNEIRSEDLRFTPGETAEFLNQTMGLDLSKESVLSLESHTEGWIAGLQLAGLALKGHDSQPDDRLVSEFIQEFTGSHRYIVSYLVEEVLSQQPSGVLNFLLKTSILDRMCGPLCEAVTEETGGQAMLEILEHANLFLIPLDDESTWYRFHHLFAQMLQARLRRSHPDLLVELHGRASEWYELHEAIADAIQHALAAGNAMRAADLIERERWKLLGRGEINILRSWLDALPFQVVRDNPGLNIAYALIFTFLEHFEGIEARIQDAERALEVYANHSADHPAQAIDAIRSEIATLRAACALRQSNIPRAIELCQNALNLLPEDNPLILGFATFYLGLSEMRSGHMKEAERIFIKASSLSLQADNIMLAMYGLAFLSIIQISLGCLSEAYETSQSMLRIPTERLRHAPPVASLAYGGLALLHYEWNDLNAAERYSRLGIEAGRLSGMKSLEISCYRILANTLQAQHNPGGVDQVLRQIAYLDDQLPNPIRTFHSAALEARLKLRQGYTEMAIYWAETCGLHSEDTVLPFLHEMEYLVLARVLIAQGQFGAVLELLARLLQAAETNHRRGSVIEILTLQAMARQKQGDLPRALDTIEHALILAEPEGYVRIFVDEGNPVLALLTDLQSITSHKTNPVVDNASLRLLAYIDRLLVAFPQTAPLASQQAEIVIEPLSERELEVLRLIAEGASNREISIRLVIANPTVKRHISNIFNKLGVGSRTQAVAVGRKLGLL
jgi:LuxR family maltose regulon positive regulatory protein